MGGMKLLAFGSIPPTPFFILTAQPLDVISSPILDLRTVRTTLGTTVLQTLNSDVRLVLRPLPNIGLVVMFKFETCLDLYMFKFERCLDLFSKFHLCPLLEIETVKTVNKNTR